MFGLLPVEDLGGAQDCDAGFVADDEASQAINSFAKPNDLFASPRLRSDDFAG